VKIALFLGCLSPEEMRLSVYIGYYTAAFCAGVALVLLLLSSRQRSFASLPLYGSLLLLHPAWTMGVFSGDCGYAKRFFSVVVSLLFVALLVLQVFWPQFSRWRFLVILGAISWASYLVLFLSHALHVPLAIGEGFLGEALQAFVLSYTYILRVALAFTLVCLIFWLFTRFYSRRSTV
jgi:peptidoglycan/LPS O-acetylase OafA/YrhL